MDFPGPPLELRAVGPGCEEPLARFYGALVAAGDGRFFHPHPLTPEEARRRSSYAGRDLYYTLAEGADVLAYGMLRGWDAGYETPSLGVIVHPACRGGGLGRLMVLSLHAAARRRGAARVRLKVYRDNEAARRLYESLGYRFSAEEAGQLVGTADLV